MKKFGNFICKYRKVIIIISLLLLIPSIIGMKMTRVNYDILTYLPEDIETVQGEDILSKEFNMGGFSFVIVDNMKLKDISRLEEDIRKIYNVEKVVSVADVVGTSVPEEMIPDEIKDKVYSDDSTVVLVTYKDLISSDATMNSVNQIRNMVDERCRVSGMTAVLIDTKNLSESEMMIYVGIAVLFCLVILQVALDSYIVPFFLLSSIGIAIFYNLGTNIFLNEVSYITKAISAVLQLGVTMDFAIFLYHSYCAERKTASTKEEAMANAISKTISSVFGSSVTTIAGFLALCSMNFTLGKDIGIVMAKGVLFGVITVITYLPAVILEADKLIEKTKHRVILPEFKHWKNFVMKFYKLIIVLFIVILPIAFYGYKKIAVYYKLDSSLPRSLSSISANETLRKDFGMVSTEMALVDRNLSAEKLNKMTEELEKVDGIKWTLSYGKLESVTSLPKEVIPNDIREIFESKNYQMVIISSKYEIATDELNSQVDKVNSILKKYDKNAILAGEGPLMKDLVEVSNHDFNSVNTISIGVIFLIMFIVLRSVSLPFILIATIELAIFINLGFSYFTNVRLPFIATIVIGTIQLGATIDYAILITNKYISARRSGKEKSDAISESLGTSISSIVVSGLCFFGATVGVSLYSKIAMIGSLCTLLSRGAIVSMITVICVLPAFLMVFDKIICKTTSALTKTDKKSKEASNKE